MVTYSVARRLGDLVTTKCAEQGLANNETCCLAEAFLPNITSLGEFIDILEYLYRICKHSLMLKSSSKATEDIVHKNMRMGIGITGYMQATDEQKSWLDAGYKYLREFDRDYSAKLKVNTSVKLTTVKPSGTLSLLPGITPGAHPGYARFMYRRIRMDSASALTAVCRQSGYPVEYVEQLDGTKDYSTVVVTFPFRFPDNAVLAKDMTAIDQLNTIKDLQASWSDNSVSCTIYYRKEELPDIREFLSKNYANTFKTLSFLLHSEHGFKQAPYEEITEEQYYELFNAVRPIEFVSNAEFEMDDECPSGVCPVK